MSDALTLNRARPWSIRGVSSNSTDLAVTETGHGCREARSKDGWAVVVMGVCVCVFGTIYGVAFPKEEVCAAGYLDVGMNVNV